MGVMEDIGGGPVGLDTAVFIYFIEEHQNCLPHERPSPSARARSQDPPASELSTACLSLSLDIPIRALEPGSYSCNP